MALTVNGEKVEDSAIQREAERLRPHYEQVFADQDPAEREAQLLDWSKENVVERILINQQVEEHGEPIPEADIESALARVKELYKDKKDLRRDFGTDDDGQIKRDIELRMRVERKLAEVSGSAPKPSEEAIDDYYEKNKEQFKTPDQARVAHIVKYVNWQNDEATAYEQITQAAEKVKAGRPFEAVVDEYTDCADTGGDLGNVARGQMVEEFEDVVFNLSPGQVSEVFRTRFGFHVAKVYDRKPGGIPALDEVKDQIVKTLQEQMREEAVNKYIDDLKSKAEIRQD